MGGRKVASQLSRDPLLHPKRTPPPCWEPCVRSSFEQGRVQKMADARAWDGAGGARAAKDRLWRFTRCPKVAERSNSDLNHSYFDDEWLFALPIPIPSNSEILFLTINKKNLCLAFPGQLQNSPTGQWDMAKRGLLLQTTQHCGLPAKWLQAHSSRSLLTSSSSGPTSQVQTTHPGLESGPRVCSLQLEWTEFRHTAWCLYV